MILDSLPCSVRLILCLAILFDPIFGHFAWQSWQPKCHWSMWGFLRRGSHLHAQQQTKPSSHSYWMTVLIALSYSLWYVPPLQVEILITFIKSNLVFDTTYGWQFLLPLFFFYCNLYLKWLLYKVFLGRVCHSNCLHIHITFTLASLFTAYSVLYHCCIKIPLMEIQHLLLLQCSTS